MNSPSPTLPAPAKTANAIRAEKTSEAWQAAQWQRWPTPADWPGVLDVYEAAAYRRVSPDTIRRACVPDRGGRAALRHQRLGGVIRVAKADLENFGVVAARP